MTSDSSRGQAQSFAAASVPPEVYDEQYYLEEMGPGSWRWFLDRANQGEIDVSGYLFRLARVQPGFRVLDIGCGRGENVLRCVQTDQVLGFGLDYSEAAVSIARRIVRSLGTESQRRRMVFVRADAQALPFAEESFDVILSHHVLEHLSDSQFSSMLRECRRVLRKEGRLVLATGPNLWRLRYGFPITRLAYRVPLLANIYRHMMGVEEVPSLAKTDDDAKYHVGEKSVFGLRTALRQAGFACTVWVGPEPGGRFSLASFRARFGIFGFVLRGLYLLLYETPPFSLVFGDAIYARAFRARER